MKLLRTLPLLVFCAPSLHAESFVATSNTGGPIPAVGDGGNGAIWPTQLPSDPAISQITLTHEVGRVYGIHIIGLVHGAVGDVQAVLRDPLGNSYNLFVRSGFDGTQFNDGDFLGGFYNFSNHDNGNGVAFPGALNSDIPGGAYRQDYGESGNPPALWPNGSAGVFNKSLTDIFAPAGTWSLLLYDWSPGKTGSFTGWELSGERPSVTPLCFGDGTQPAPCPCANSGAAGHGCNNSLNTGGAQLSASGSFTPDTIVLESAGELPTALTIFIQGGWTGPTGNTFGDGVRCFAGASKRLFVKSAVGGVASAPGPGDPTIRERSAQLGFTLEHGGFAIYQAYYRDANASFCSAPTGNTFNISNALMISWP